jgi:NADPH-dependent ferric siderophore reductase
MDQITPGPASDAGQAAPERTRPALSEAELERRRGKPWTLRVASMRDVTPGMRRIQLTATDLGEFRPRAAQEIVLQLPQADGETARRHYTIRAFDPAAQLIDVDFVLHGDNSPGVRWAREAKIGDIIEIRGPRGRMAVAADASWHLFTGDETALPAIYAMVESLPAETEAIVFIEIGAETDKQPLETAAKLHLTYLIRQGAGPGPSRLMIDAVERFTLPAGNGFAYILGETSNVRAQRQFLIERGLPRDRIYSEGYWRPGRIGGHDHVDDRSDARG